MLYVVRGLIVHKRMKDTRLIKETECSAIDWLSVLSLFDVLG